MKISKTDFAKLEEKIKPLDTSELREKYKEFFKSNEKYFSGKGDKNMRYRWDLFSLHNGKDSYSFVKHLYNEGLNDNHIDTALRKIVPNYF